MTALWIGLGVAALLAVVVVSFWRKRAAARRWLEHQAVTFGVNRLPSETDEELRERMRQTLRTPPRFNRETVRTMVTEALWRHGYPRTAVELFEPGFGHVRAHAVAEIPAATLHAIDEELRDLVPVTFVLELTSGRASPDRSADT